MSGGCVSGNTAIKGSDLDTEYQLNGAGLYAGTGATITVSGGTITENHAKENGGGLYTAQNDSIIILEGGTISSNTADYKGNGIAIANGYLKMKGNASVDSNNDVYLASGKVITVTGSLTGTAPVATITPASYDDETKVLEAGNDVILTDELDKFAVTTDSFGKQWAIDSYGKLFDDTVVSISKDDLSSFTPNSSTVYTIVTDNTLGNDEINSLISKIQNSVGEGTVLDLSLSTATSITEWVYSGVTSITLPGSVSSLAWQIFQNASSLKEIKVPDSNTTYTSQDGVLYTKDMTGLIKYPDSKEGDTFTLPETVRQLKYQAFHNNKNLVTIRGLSQIQSFIDNDSDGVFSGCKKLEEIDLSGLTCSSLSSYTIRYSSALKKVIISSNISLIEFACFQSLSSLEEVHFKGMTPPQIQKDSDASYKNFISCPNVKFYVPSAAVDDYKNATGTNGFTNPSCNGSASTTEEICAKIIGE